MTETIRAGNKSAFPPLFGLHLGVKAVQYTITCHESMWYELNQSDKDWQDIHKLCGIGFGLYWKAHHQNSYRIGWRPTFEKGFIQLFHYMYIRGKPVRERLITVPVNVEFIIVLKIIEDEIYIFFNGIPAGSYSGFSDTYNLGYWLYFTHGGNLPAPQRMSCSITRSSSCFLKQ